MKTSDWLIIGGVGIGALYLTGKIGSVAGSVAKAAGDVRAKASLSLSDMIPTVVNTYEPNTTSTSQGYLLPKIGAPYWYDVTGTKRTTPMKVVGTVYDAAGNRLQISNTATQAARYVSVF